MKVISVPGKLLGTVFILTLCVPLVGAEIIIYTRAPWWNLPYDTIRIWGSLVAGFVCLLGFGLVRGSKVSYYVTYTVGIVWSGLTLWLAVSTQNFWLGIFFLFLCLFWLILIISIQNEMSRSFFNPYMNWYQGEPSLIPDLECWVGNDGKRALCFKVGRLDRDGVFIFNRNFEDRTSFEVTPKDQLKLELRFRDKTVKCSGVPIRVLTPGLGVGIQFRGVSQDQRKDLMDLVELLRGVGYVRS